MQIYNYLAEIRGVKPKNINFFVKIVEKIGGVW